MNPLANRAVLEQTSFDSAMPAGTAVLVHRFERPGRYAVALSPDGLQVVETKTLFVGAEADEPGDEAQVAATKGQPRARRIEPPRPNLAGAALPQAIALDLSRSPHLVNAAAPLDVNDAAVLQEGGFATFTAPAGQAHRVMVNRVGREGELEKEFDSTRLGPADVFAITLFRPGTYSITNAFGGHQARLVVTYPQVGREPYRPAEPVTVHSREGGFEPAVTTIGPGQGVIFEVESESRITVDLVEPDDGPGDKSGGRRPLARRQLRPVARPAGQRPDAPPEPPPGRGGKAGGAPAAERPNSPAKRSPRRGGKAGGGAS